MVTDWSTFIQSILQQLLPFIGRLVFAIVVFVIGYLISIGIGRLVAEILKSVKFNKLFEKEGWKKALQRANVEVNPSEFIGVVFKWIFIIVALLLAVDILRLTAFAGFLNQVLNYLPNVVLAVLIFVVAIVIADIVEKVVRATVERLRVGYGFLAASIVKWAIWIFSFFLVLGLLLPPQANVLVQTLYSAIVYGVVAALALGIGLAIGLGGKETAGRIISDLYRKIEEK